MTDPAVGTDATLESLANAKNAQDAANAVAFYLAHVGRHLRDFLVAGAKCEFVKADTLRRVTEALINLR